LWWLLILALFGLCLNLLLGRNTFLQPWHSVRLAEEFSEEKRESIRTFDQYLRLEERLFKELEQRIYGEPDGGKGSELCRYRSGNPADPHRLDPDWNRSFELVSEKPLGGILLLHGMSDSPYSLRVLGKDLNRRGYWVVGLRLPGHGTVPSGLKFVTWEEMNAVVGLAAQHLSAKIGRQPLHVIGYSTGASLALNYSLDALHNESLRVPTSLILISPAIGLHPAAGLAGIKNWLSYLPGLGHMAWLSILPEFDPYKYNSFATNAGNQVHHLTRIVSRRIAAWVQDNPPEVFPPTLIFKSTVDATVSENAVVDDLLNPLNSPRHELVLFDINRLSLKSSLMISNPSPFTERLMSDHSLPFALTLVTNENQESLAVVAMRQDPWSNGSPEVSGLGLRWPRGVFSLSHVALPIDPTDPLYGELAPVGGNLIHLGQLDLKGERNVLKIPYDWLLRMRYNPFFEYLEQRTMQWVEDVH
jgi:alpha-beta hydrolase superfamily lysophospholipase